jgi:alkylation response protein AidB-like acyl-CoA dehydrogenase
VSNAVAAEAAPAAIHEWWSERRAGGVAPATQDPAVASRLLHDMVAARILDLPLPGRGRTAERFDALSALGRLDTTTGRLAEAHTDALAILAELAGRSLPGMDDEVWGVWAAEPPNARVVARQQDGDDWRLRGRKAWCSGAGTCTYALVTAWAGDGQRLFAVDLHGAGVETVDDGWPMPALAGTDTRSVDFADARARPVGAARAYLDRPGFWHGAVGVAAVWYGGAVGVADALRRRLTDHEADDIDRVHLGSVDRSLWAARSALLAAAAAIDADPGDDGGVASVVALRTRAVVEASVASVIDRVGRALGPAPLTRDEAHARRVVDLALYVRQSHADRDLADLADRVLATDAPW